MARAINVNGNWDRARRDGVAILMRPHPLSNPHSITHPCNECRRTVTTKDAWGDERVVGGHQIWHTREEALSLYQNWFDKRTEDPEFRRYLEQYRHAVLGCVCKPAACHLDTIVEYFERNPI